MRGGKQRTPLGDCRNGLARQVLQYGAAPGDEAAVTGRQRRLLVIQAALHVAQPLLEISLKHRKHVLYRV